MAELRVGDKRAFFEAPFQVYGPNSLYVPLMWDDVDRCFDKARNPLFKDGNDFRLFTLHEGDRIIGRICAHTHNSSNALHGLRRSCFGYFDVVDRLDAAATLLSAAEAFGREQGANEVAGNFNLTAMQQIGVMTEGFDQAPYTDMGYSGPHLPALLAACGYAPFFPVSTTELDLTRADLEALLTPRAKAALAAPDFEWMRIDRRHFAARMEDARVAANDAFATNPMYVPVSCEEYQFIAKEMLWIIDPRISCCVRAQGQPAGVLICIPDLNPFIKAVRGRLGWRAPLEFIRHRMNRKRAVMIYYATVKSQQGRGLNTAMLYRTLVSLRAAGYEQLGLTWVSDENEISRSQVDRLGTHLLHRLHLFRKAI